MGVGWVIIEKLERSVEGAFLSSDRSAWRDLLTLPLVGCDWLLWGVRPLYSLTAGGIFPCMFKWVSAWKTGEEHATVCLTSDSAWKTCICMLWPSFWYSLWCKVKPYIKLRMCSVLFRPGSPGRVPWGAHICSDQLSGVQSTGKVLYNTECMTRVTGVSLDTHRKIQIICNFWGNIRKPYIFLAREI